MELLDFILEVLSKTLNKDKNGVAELIKSEDGKVKTEALNSILQEYSDHIKKVKTESMDEGHKKATRTARETLEKEIKEALGLDTDKKGVELAKFIKEQAEADARESGKELTEDAVKKTPAFLKLERELAETKVKSEKEKNEAVDALKKEYQSKETFQTVAQKALKRVEDLKAILPKNPEVAENLKSVFLEKLKENSYSLDGEKINILKEGENLKDHLGHIVDFDKYVDSLAGKFFEFQVADDRSSSGANSGGAGGKDKVSKVVVPKTKEEFNKAYFEEPDANKRLELKKVFDEEQKALEGK